MAGFFFSADPRNFYQSSGMVGGGNFIQQNPFGMVSPAQYGMVSSTPYGMVNPTSYGMVSSTPYGMVNPTAYGMVNPTSYVGLVAQPQRQVTMCPAHGIEISPYVRSPSCSGLLAIQSNDTDNVDTPRMRTPFLEEVRDNTQLVPRKPKVSPSVQNETYALNDCKKYLDNLSQKISDSEKRIADSRNVIVDSVKVFADLKKKRDMEVGKQEREKEKHEQLLRKLRGLQIKDSSRKCTICMDREKNAVILPCGHTTCMECATEVYVGENQRCPICRADIQDINPLYFD
ncbi:uncharacterized protein LOC127721296 [Mytilus californianus]|uniref:uncharacterized protein LOC127721296 n=1 Tax=Mytilus californianus TaxID=6549 RepID=UPI0022469D30|nr:uncharacterized protein LOC127721296 [Mytilus californianus]